MKMIPLVKVAMPDKNILMPALESVLYSGMVGEGELVYKFEEEFGNLYNLDNIVAVNSGTAALHLALILSDVKSGDEILTTSMTAEPTNTTILNCGCKPIFCDVDPENGNISIDSAREKINKKTKAICVVHYAGYPVDIIEFRKLADEYNIPLIEDCAHALGATVHGKSVGSYGNFAIFSFQAIKHITTIDGGVLVVNNKSDVERAKRLRWFGMAKGIPRTEVDIKEVGYKYNMNNVTATFGLAQLKYADGLIKKHINNGLYFNECFKNFKKVKPATQYQNTQGSFWLYTLLCEDSDKLEMLLTNNGVNASKLHRPNHLHSVFNSRNDNLPQLDMFYKRMLHIPCGWWLSEEEREHIKSIIVKYENETN